MEIVEDVDFEDDDQDFIDDQNDFLDNNESNNSKIFYFMEF